MSLFIWANSLLYIFEQTTKPLIILYILAILTLLTVLILQTTKVKKLKQDNLQLTLFSRETPLPNRTALRKDVEEIIPDSTTQDMALLYVDIDNFRYIHVIEDHEYADLVLYKVSERLISLAQPRGRVYHLSEDKFAILFPNTGQNGIGEVMAANILAGFKERFEISGNELYINLSIGIVDHPPVDITIEEVLTAAQIAMYHAKEAGRNHYFLYKPDLSLGLQKRTNIQNHLRLAFERNEFEIHYQPQLDLDFDRIDGFEALLRWTSKELGPIAPNQFIKIAESSHLIHSLGTWVLRSACAFIKELEKMGYPHLNISVNVSVMQLMQEDFVATVQETLEFLELAPEHLELEITESMLMKSFQKIIPKLQELREMGVRIALDDFGTGYSSLSYLSQIPITTLKLEKTFIDKIGTDQEGLTESILYLCNKLHLNAVAEGVEKDSQISYLKEMGCQRMQGYLFSKPLPEQGIFDLLKAAPTLFDEPFTHQAKSASGEYSVAKKQNRTNDQSSNYPKDAHNQDNRDKQSSNNNQNNNNNQQVETDIIPNN